jgi:ketosteroid isomerase-like protein
LRSKIFSSATRIHRDKKERKKRMDMTRIRQDTREMQYALKALTPLLLFCLALFIVTGLMVTDAFAFEGHRGPDPERMLAHLTEDLDLSEEQVELVAPILENQHEMIKAVFEDTSLRGDRDAMHAEMEAIREETELQLEAVLTEAQMESFRELPHKRMHDRHQRPDLD